MTRDQCNIDVVLWTSIDALAEPPSTKRYDILEIIKQSLIAILARIHAGHFRIALSLCSQALPTPLILLFEGFSALSPAILWTLSLSELALPYLLRCLFCFDVMRSEFTHHVGVNYMFAPSMSWLLLLAVCPRPQQLVLPGSLVGLRDACCGTRCRGVWTVTKGKRFLSTVANPTRQLSMVGNLVGARVAAETGWREVSICLFSLGLTHYLVIFITLYQRIAASKSLPSMLRPVFFLFIAAPCMASIAWSSISRSFDNT